MRSKKIVYIDMDGVLVNFETGIARLSKSVRDEYQGRLDEVPGIFSMMEPMPNAVEAFYELAGLFDAYILSTAPWQNPSAWRDKLLWVKKHIGETAHKRLILTHHKNLNSGDYLIDDRMKNGVERFEGEHLWFGSEEFPDWQAVLKYLKEKNDFFMRD